MEQHITTYGIIGNPVSQSLSPLMHNAAFKVLEVDAVYQRFPLTEDELPGFMADLKDPDCPIFGLNVTVPYKESVLPFLDSLSPFAEKAQSVNTIVINPQRKLAGFNTDGPGFLAHLQELDFVTGGKRIAILGAGGTTRAIITSLCLLPQPPAVITLYNRTIVKAENLCQDLAQRMDVSMLKIAETIEEMDIGLADLLINTTSVGLHANDPLLVPQDLLHKNLLVYDVIYNPSRTPLLKQAKKRGAQIANGLGMLYYQGVLALEHWADTPVDEQVKIIMRQSLEEGAAGK
jgi:shikimate dehydrogenase